MEANKESVSEQARRYSKSIGKGITAEHLDAIINFSSDVTRKDWYARKEHLPFWYERFDKDGLTDKLSALADAWVNSEANIIRAATQVHRDPKEPGAELVLAFGIYRFKRYFFEEWKLVERPAMGRKDKELQTMVCIALEDLGPTNGFPFDLKCGEDVCIDGNDSILLPPTGGGKAILIWIDL